VKLPRDVTGAEAVRALQRHGFVLVRQTGSHQILRKAGVSVVVPQHKSLKPGTLKGLIAQAGLSVPKFLEEL